MAGGPLPLRQLQAEPVRQGSQYQAFLLVDHCPCGRQPDQSGLGSKILLKKSTFDHFLKHYAAMVKLPLATLQGNRIYEFPKKELRGLCL